MHPIAARLRYDTNVLPVRTALVGLGYWGPNLLRNFGAQELCDLAYACDLSDANIAKARAKYPAIRYVHDIGEILSDPSVELVLIATPTSTHFPLAKRALEAGKHVFVEKPIASTPAEADALMDLARRTERLLFVDHTFVFAPAVQELGKYVTSGRLGEPLYFDSIRANLGLIQKDINVLFDLAIHDLSILHTLVRLEEVETIAAHGSKHFGEQEEQVHVYLTFRSGFSAHISVSWLSPVKIRQTILGGTKAMALYDDTQPSEKLKIYDKGIDQDTSKPDPFFPKYRSGDILIPALLNEETLAIEARHVLRCVHGEEQPLVSGKDGAAILRLLHLADQSLKQDSRPLHVS